MPPRLALLAKAGPAFVGLWRIELMSEFALQLRQKLFRRREGQPAEQSLGIGDGVRTGVQHFVHQPVQGSRLATILAELVNEAEAHGLAGREALPRQQVAAQPARIDGTKKERNK